jgi:hypothetical protein
LKIKLSDIDVSTSKFQGWPSHGAKEKRSSDEKANLRRRVGKSFFIVRWPSHGIKTKVIVLK